MTASPDALSALRRGADRFGIRDGEAAELGLSFVMFFAVLASYMTIRPLRDTLGAGLPRGGLEGQFGIVLLVMIALVPVFGAVSTWLPKRLVLPAVYGFFACNLLAFAALLSSGTPAWLASAFFVWGSVYNLYVVSLFWSQMSGLWSSEAGKRLFGVISAGGTLGSITGPSIAGPLAKGFGPHLLPLVSAGFLGLAVAASLMLSRMKAQGTDTEAKPLTLPAVQDGALHVWRQPYFRRIALVIFLANLVSTVFYLEQSRLIKLEIPDQASRVAFFASRDLAVSVATALIQLFGTAWIIKRLGLTAGLASLPLVCVAGLAVFGAFPTLLVVSTIMVVERITAFALAVPSIRVLYTVVEPDEKFKAQNFIDTVVYRAGDATSGIISHQAGPWLLAAALPFAGLWLWASAGLGAMHARRAGEVK